MQAMCWGSGPGGPCAKGSDGLRKGPLKARLGLEWWDTPPEGQRISEIRTLPYLIASRFLNFYRGSDAKLLLLTLQFEKGQIGLAFHESTKSSRFMD